MNRRMIFNTVGLMLKVEAALLLLPALAALIYGESCLWSILISAAISLAAGFALTLLSRPKSQVIYAREGFITVALAWIAVSAVGALPFYISREIPSYIDAFFETVSGFTTTGASILANVEVMSRGLLFWRSFTHWVGGMGVLVFVMALVPSVTDRSIHIMRAEMPGPVVGKLMPRARDTASILYKIYVGMTLLQIILLWIGGMPLFESIVHAFGTAGTGGFGVKADSIAGYSPYLQWVITVFMLLFGINFNLYYLLLIRRFRAAAQSSECWYYLGIVGVCIALITVNILPMYQNFQEALRLSAFQVASIVTTTGYATADFNLWPQFSKAILLLLMIMGACAGSTGGGLKVSRAVMLFKMVGKEIRHLLHPRSVNSVRFEGKHVDGATLKSVSSYFVIYIICILAICLILSLEPFDLETNLSATLACFNTIGPGLAAVGPASNYAAYSPLSKLVLSLAMLLGRLEIYPLLLTLSPATWMKQ
ncbi:MAG: TrkH family potassium uptake protein [Eubacteriales bacterium]|nr:TrkH family potassium uptake protein [Eubacteriales bacterium]